MKAKRSVLGVAVALFASTAAFQASACGIHFGFSLPFLSFGIGLGLGTPCAWPAYGCGYAYPAYAYAQPAYAYAYDPPVNYIPPMAATVPGPTVAEAQPWVPSTPGTGHWVPDPEPYSYTPAVVTKRAPTSTSANTETTVTRSPEGVPVYIVTQVQRRAG